MRQSEREEKTSISQDIYNRVKRVVASYSALLDTIVQRLQLDSFHESCNTRQIIHTPYYRNVIN